MWHKLPHWIIKNRVYLSILIILITIVMGYYASKVQLSYEFARTLPLDDPEMLALNAFRSKFGEDANIIAVGFQDSAVYQLSTFREFQKLSQEISKIPGVNNVIALPLIKYIHKDTAQSRFRLIDLFPPEIHSQSELDSLLQFARGQQFYMGQIVNVRNGANMFLVAVDKAVMNSSRRDAMTASLLETGAQFTEKTGIKLRYAGLPFIRAVIGTQVKKEMAIFLYASAIVTGIIMFLFFRSISAVLFSLLIIGIVVVWTLGTLALFGFKITLLSGLIPPVIVTIGITNAIYLLNKYHLEYIRSKDKVEAIYEVVRKMGLATFLTNLTVAIGFLSLLATDILILREFGIVAGLNILALFFVSLVMFPSVLSWLPTPQKKHLRHLQFAGMNSFLRSVDVMVHRHRVYIYGTSVALALISLFGILQLHSVSFMVDDIPEDSDVKKDLTFFENNFSGVMPLEFVVEFKSKRKRPLLDVDNLKKVESFEGFLDSLKYVSRPVSLVSFVKASKQSFYNNNPDRYALPSKSEASFILRYMRDQDDNSGIFKSFVDSSFSTMRISTQIADIGSARLDSLVNTSIKPRMEQIFVPTKRDSIITTVTGSTTMFIKGNKFLIANLQESLLLAFLFITLSMVALFANFRMIIISLIPNLLALMITAGLMGYFNIPLKASTALIFSITFGISVDNSIRFLAKYRQEIFSNNFYVPLAVSESILETGKSIIYTSIVLFAGFIIFAFSDFGGTIALGLLTSTTLLISMFTNVILLPALVLTFDKPKKRPKDHQLIDDIEPTFYGESEDEEIDLSKIRVQGRKTSEP